MSWIVFGSVSVDHESGLSLCKKIVASCSCHRVDMVLLSCRHVVQSCRVVVVVSKIKSGVKIC